MASSLTSGHFLVVRSLIEFRARIVFGSFLFEARALVLQIIFRVQSSAEQTDSYRRGGQTDREY